MLPPLTFGAVSDLGQRDRGFVGDAGQYLGICASFSISRVGGAFDLSFAGCGGVAR
jgi:hypothetical protein